MMHCKVSLCPAQLEIICPNYVATLLVMMSIKIDFSYYKLCLCSSAK